MMWNVMLFKMDVNANVKKHVVNKKKRKDHVVESEKEE